MQKTQQFVKASLWASVAIIATSFSLSTASAAPICTRVTHRDAEFSVCFVDPTKSDVRVFFADAKGERYGGFDRLKADLSTQGSALAFAMNGGMYHPDYRPVGLYIERQQQLTPLNKRAGKGNFGLKPNGVFWVKGRSAGVTEAQRFANQNIRPDFATQSGPMLVIDGKIHPKIHETGTSEKIRNGVGQCDDGKIKFAISDSAVTFHTFATLFSETLKCPQALYLDGSISAIYAPGLKRNDGWLPLGPIIGVVESGAK